MLAAWSVLKAFVAAVYAITIYQSLRVSNAAVYTQLRANCVQAPHDGIYGAVYRHVPS